MIPIDFASDTPGPSITYLWMQLNKNSFRNDITGQRVCPSIRFCGGSLSEMSGSYLQIRPPIYQIFEVNEATERLNSYTLPTPVPSTRSSFNARLFSLQHVTTNPRRSCNQVPSSNILPSIPTVSNQLSPSRRYSAAKLGS